jgi:hypothetical protein
MRGQLRLPERVERGSDVFNPSVLNMRWVRGRRILWNAIPVPRPRDLRRHVIDLKTRNATPLRTAPWSRATCCYVASVAGYGDGCRRKATLFMGQDTSGRER